MAFSQTSKWILSTAILILHYFSHHHHHFAAAAAARNIPAVIVFGDSSVDAGNNNQYATLLRSNFKPYGRDFAGGPTGRFCNGRIPPDFISEGFGLRPTVPAYLDPAYGISDFATGVCFASAGTGYDNATSDVLVSIIIFLFLLGLRNIIQLKYLLLFIGFQATCLFFSVWFMLQIIVNNIPVNNNIYIFFYYRKVLDSYPKL